eukprot:scaffold438905_cov18-Prasinocladus_malaysianus.AAC.1
MPPLFILMRVALFAPACLGSTDEAKRAVIMPSSGSTVPQPASSPARTAGEDRDAGPVASAALHTGEGGHSGSRPAGSQPEVGAT